MSSDSTRTPRARKAAGRPEKPYPDFPLYPHPLGYWSKKVLGRPRHYGRWGRLSGGVVVPVPYEQGWQEALTLYKAQIDDHRLGRESRVRMVNGQLVSDQTGLTVADLCNRFLTAKHHKVLSGEVGARMFEDYRKITDLLVAELGKNRLVGDLVAKDFEALQAGMAGRWGPVRLGNAIIRVKSVFKYGVENGLIEKAVQFGSEFKKPGKAKLRQHRAAAGEKMLEAEQIRGLIDAASVPLRAMILLGVNAAYGNHDVASLPADALDLDRGWLDFPRPKTGIPRRCPLWPETVVALRAAGVQRPQPARDEDSDRVFLNSRGTAYIRTTARSHTDLISVQFGDLLKKLGLHRDGIGFYTLRHVFRTVADAARDPVAIDLIMGHADHTMGGHYRERIDDSRLRAVADHVRRWLFVITSE